MPPSGGSAGPVALPGTRAPAGIAGTARTPSTPPTGVLIIIIIVSKQTSDI